MNTQSTFTQTGANSQQIQNQNNNFQNLKNVIDVTPNPQSPTEYSDGVNSWIGKVTVKALTESWDVVKGVGIGIFPELIKVYYGI